MRERIWKDVEELIEEGDAVMAWAAPTDQGYDFATVGRNRRMPVGFDGLKLGGICTPGGCVLRPGSSRRRGGRAPS